MDISRKQQIVQVPDFQEDCNSQREVSIATNSHDVPLYGAGPSLKQAIADHHHIPLGLTIDVKSQINLFGGIVRKYFLTTIACDVLFNPDTGSVAATYCEPPKMQDSFTISHLFRGKTTLKGQWKTISGGQIILIPQKPTADVWSFVTKCRWEPYSPRVCISFSPIFAIWVHCLIPPWRWIHDSNQKPAHKATGLHLAIYTLQKICKHPRLYCQQEWCRKSYFLIVTQD